MCPWFNINSLSTLRVRNENIIDYVLASLTILSKVKDFRFKGALEYHEGNSIHKSSAKTCPVPWVLLGKEIGTFIA